MQFFRIDVNSNPQFNLAITPHIAGGKIVAAVGGSYTRWNYNSSDKTISSYYDPAYVIASKAKTSGVHLEALAKTTKTTIYKKWTWNPSTKTFSLDASPNLIMTVDGSTLAEYKPIVLGDNTAVYYQWNVVLSSPNMPNISIAIKSKPSLMISANTPTTGIPAPTPYLAPKTAKFVTWNYTNMQLLPIGASKKIAIYSDAHGTFLGSIPAKSSPQYNSTIWTWDDNEGTFVHEPTKKKLGVNELTVTKHGTTTIGDTVTTKNPAYSK